MQRVLVRRRLCIPVNLIRMGRGDPAGVVRECGYDVFFLQHLLQLEDGFAQCRQAQENLAGTPQSFVDVELVELDSTQSIFHLRTAHRISTE